MTRLIARILFAVVLPSVIVTAAPLGAGAQESSASIAGVWQAREGMPSGLASGASASDVQTLFLTPDGTYRREVVVEGGDGANGAAGKIIDAGTYTFTAPNTFRYRRKSWSVCQMGTCRRGRPIGNNDGALPFLLHGSRHATFIGLAWTRTG